MNAAAEKLESLVALAKERERNRLLAELAALDAPAPPPVRQEAPLGAEWLDGLLAKLASITPATADEVATDRELRRVRPRIAAAGISGEHLRELTITNARQQLALSTIRAKVASGTGAICVLFGPRGTGKTQIAAQIVRDFAERTVREEDDYAYAQKATPRDYSCAYLTAADLFGRMKELYANVGTINAESRAEEMECLARLDIVIVDELQESTNASEQRIGFGKILTALCDKRYANRKPTILISNHYDPAKPTSAALVIDFLGDSIVSRAKQYGGFIIADWKSFREKPHNPITP